MGDLKLCSPGSAAEHCIPMTCAVLGSVHRRGGRNNKYRNPVTN